MLMIMQTIEQDGKRNPKELDQLLRSISAGNQDALADLYCRTQAGVYAMALSILKNAHDAQDVTQETFVRIWDCAHQYRAQGSPMAWILTIARNLALTKLRQDARLTDLDEMQWNALPADTPSVTPEDRHLLQSGLATLCEEERRIIMLHAATGLKHREIALLLEIPLATALSKYHRALKKLRLFMEGDGPL